MRKYLAFYWVSMQATLAYRGTHVIWFSSNLISAITIIAVWFSVQSGSLIGGYAKGELITYYLIGNFWWWVTGWFPFYWIQEEIANGEIVGNSLLKPVSFWVQTFAREAGWHTVGLIIGLSAVGLVSLFLGNYFILNLNPYSLFLFFLATIMSILITMTLSVCQGLICFWTTRVGALDSLFWLSYSLLGGQFVPVSFFPYPYRLIVEGTPFRYMFAFPIEVYLGKLSGAEMFHGFMVASAWVVLLFLLYKWLWGHGRLAYTSFGQ